MSQVIENTEVPETPIITPKYNSVTTYENFIQYVLKRLGAPVINIEVSDDQIKDRVSDAIQFVTRNCSYDTTREFFWLYKITTEDVTRGYLELPASVLDITEIRGKSTSTSYDAEDLLGDPEYQFWQNYWTFGAANTNLTYYEMTMQELRTINLILRANIQFTWVSNENKLYLYKNLLANKTVMFRGYKLVDPETSANIWDSMFLKMYATALVGIQWGTNLSKFNNVPASGGLTIDATAILQRYSDEKIRLEEEFMNKYTYPAQFFIA